MRDAEKTRGQLIGELEELRRQNALLQDPYADEGWTKVFSSALIQWSPIGIYVVQDGRFAFVTTQFQKIVGYSEAELVGMNSLDVVLPEDRELVRENAKRMLKGKLFSPYEFRIVNRDGEIRYIEETVGSTLYRGKWAVLGNFVDITKRRLMEMELRKSEEKFRTTFESAPDWVTISRMEDGKYRYVNDAYCASTGYSREQVIDRTAFELGLYVHPTDRERLLRLLKEKGRADGFELQFRMKDGRIIDALLSGKLFPYDDEVLLIAVTKDITELKRAQMEIRRSEKRYRDLFNSVSDLIFSQDLEGRFTSVNRAMNEMFGYKPGQLIGRRAADFMKPELRPLYDTMYLDALKREGHIEGISSYFAKEGRKIYLEYRSNLVRPEKGEAHITGIARDVTERILAEREIKRLQDQMLQAQKMEAVGTLAGGVAHDFNNLLQAILGYTQILLMSTAENDADTANLKQIERTALRASELTQRLLTFSRKVESRLRPVDLNQEVEQLHKLLKRTIPKMIGIELRLQPHLHTINADPAQLEQVMMNLGVNARDAMPDGGRLVLETANVHLDEEFCMSHLGTNPGSYVLLSIGDTGSGMDKETVDHIFEPFFTTKEVGKGTGLGLAMVYGIVKGHKGYIDCSSKPGGGTTFKIYFPVMDSEAEAYGTEAEMEDSAPRGVQETILLVDDEEMLRNIGKDILERSGYTVLTARDGESALGLYRKMVHDPPLVVLDLIMPGMGGKQCLAEILKMDPDAKVLIASGYSIDEEFEKVVDAGARAFIKKPYQVRQLLRVVREVLDGA